MNTIRRNTLPILTYQLRYQKRLSIETDYPINVLRSVPRVFYHLFSQFHTGTIRQDSENATIESLHRKILYRSTINEKVGVYGDDATSNNEAPRIRRKSELNNSPELIT